MSQEDETFHIGAEPVNLNPLDPKGAAGAAKCPLALLPPEALKLIALVHQAGAKKYGAFNWREAKVCATTYISAIMRHLDAWRDGENLDPEDGLCHLAHIGSNINILIDAAANGMLVDDRYKMPRNESPSEVQPLPAVEWPN